MSLRVYIEPSYQGVGDRAEGGIRRVSEAQFKYLPAFDVEPVTDPRRADVLAGHGVIVLQGDKPFVSHCHGLHWAEYQWPHWAHDVNRRVTEALVRAQAITVPSQWVREAVTRGILAEPTVIYHGVEPEEWAPRAEPAGYVLWNKARQDPVSDPGDLQRLAARMEDVPFVSTLGELTANVKICGVRPLPELKPIIQQASVYLATARETFGIGTLEALASGVPVAGWNYGGQSEIIREGETGYLAPYGDYVALADAVRRCLAERERLSANAIADVHARWLWPDKISRYAEVYRSVLTAAQAERPTVSVLVTCHNLARYLPAALQSVQQQTFEAWEGIVVDDASSDDTPTVAAEWVKADKRFAYVRTPSNLKLSGARNFGFAQARGRYVINLDADDLLEANALATLTAVLNQHPELHIAYGALDLMDADGRNRRRNEWPRGGFLWQAQLSHINQLHYSALLRREVWERTGGFRERMWRAEDAEFWCRATSFGFRADQVTDEPTLIYRLRPDSKGQTEYRTYADKDGPWHAWFPWHQAQTATEGSALLSQNLYALPNLQLVPFSAQGQTPDPLEHWRAWHRQEPLVSVIIPVGPGHQALAINALDSLVAQDLGAWEAIVINDTGEDWTLRGAPYARVFHTPGRRGAGYARNMGLAVARGPLVLFLDADDWLLPGALSRLLVEYVRGNTGYVYSDYLEVDRDWRETPKTVAEYAQGEWRGQHAITVLMAKTDAQRMGFDDDLPGWEDWDFFLKCAVAGICGRRVPEPLFAYRFTTGQNRERDLAHADELLPVLKARYGAYYTGEKRMAGCCGGNREAVAAILAVKQLETDGQLSVGDRAPALGEPGVPDANDANFIRMEFIGPQTGAITFTGKNGAQYRGGNNDVDRYADVVREDAEKLVLSGQWRRVPPPPPVVSEPTPTPAVLNAVSSPLLAEAQVAAPVPPELPSTPSEPIKTRKVRSRKGAP